MNRLRDYTPRWRFDFLNTFGYILGIMGCWSPKTTLKFSYHVPFCSDSCLNACWCICSSGSSIRSILKNSIYCLQGSARLWWRCALSLPVWFLFALRSLKAACVVDQARILTKWRTASGTPAKRNAAWRVESQSAPAFWQFVLPCRKNVTVAQLDSRE